MATSGSSAERNGRVMRHRWRARQVVVVVAVVLALVVVFAVACAPRQRPATAAERAEYRSAVGRLVAWDTTRIGDHGRYAMYRVRMESSTGLRGAGRLLQPREAGTGEERHPAILLNDGRELDSRVVESLPREFGDVVVLSMDFPDELPYELSPRRVFSRLFEIREASRRVPALFSLGGAYLAQRHDVDPARLGIVATSFSVPFATIAAAADTTFRNVGLVYGAGQLDRVLAANLELRPRWLRRPAAVLAMAPFTEFEPTRFAAAISPRPIVMINSIDDPQMPTEAARALYDAAREPKTIVWMRTGHLMPTDTALILELVDSAFARLPVLRGR